MRQSSFNSRVGVLLVTGLAPCAWAGVVGLGAGARYPEGPLWHDGALLYVDYGGRSIRRWDGAHWSPYWSRDACGPSGLIDFGQDHLLVACYDANRLVELDEHAHEVRTIDRDDAGKPFVGPNDFCADGAGGVYFTASGVYDVKAPITGSVLHLTADGRSVRVLADSLHYPNGLTLSRDHRHLLVAEMLAARIVSFSIRADGGLDARTVWARMQDIVPPTPGADAYNGPDGFKLGPDGNYYIAQNGSGRVLIVDDERHLVRSIAVPTPNVTNMAFGPDAATTLYVTGVFDQWKAPFPGEVYRWTP